MLASIAGCGGGSGGSTLTQNEFCAKKAANECMGVADRCAATSAACKAKRVFACDAFAVVQQAAPSSPTTRPFRPDLAGACLSKATEVYAKPLITPTDRNTLDEACARVFSGKKKATDATEPTCVSDYECDANQICDSFFKTCAPKKPVAANAGCNNPGEICPAGQFCTGSPRKCVPRQMAGETCDASPCLETLRCVGGTCAERVGLTMHCASDDDCLPEVPYCDTFNGSICTTGFSPSTLNAECIGAFGAMSAGSAGSDDGGV